MLQLSNPLCTKQEVRARLAQDRWQTALQCPAAQVVTAQQRRRIRRLRNSSC